MAWYNILSYILYIPSLTQPLLPSNSPPNISLSNTLMAITMLSGHIAEERGERWIGVHR